MYLYASGVPRRDSLQFLLELAHALTHAGTSAGSGLEPLVGRGRQEGSLILLGFAVANLGFGQVTVRLLEPVDQVGD